MFILFLNYYGIILNWIISVKISSSKVITAVKKCDRYFSILTLNFFSILPSTEGTDKLNQKYLSKYAF